MAINTQKFLPASKSGSLVVKTKDISKGGSLMVVSERSQKNALTIKSKTIEVDKLLKGTLAADKKELDNKKRESGQKRKEDIETKLETKPQSKNGKIEFPKRPKMGILDWIKNYIGNIILGFFAVRLVDHLPKFIPVLKFIGAATDLVINFGGKLLDGLVTFVDWGYKAYDATRGFLKNLGGENFAKVFDGFNGAVGTLIETAIITATVLASQGDDGLLDIGGDIIRDRLLGKGAQGAAQAAAGGKAATGLGAGAVGGIIAGAGLLASALGEGAFQLRKVAIKPLQDTKKAFDKERNPLVKAFRGAQLAGMGMLLGPLSALGVLLDVVGAPFRYAIELLRFPFLSEEDKQKQAFNLAKLDARIREDFRKALNLVTLGFAFKEKGSFGNIYGNKGAQNEMMSKMAGGGITRGGKSQRGATRSIGGNYKTKKYKRVIPQKPGEVEVTSPGASVGGEEKLFGLFPNPLKFAQKAVDTINPFKVIENSGKNLGKSDYFGPILAITSKILLGQKPNQNDYKNVGLGINLLLYKGIEEGKLKGGLAAAFAEGGLVDPETLSAAVEGGDISNWVAGAFKEATETNAQKTLREIQENLKLKKEVEEEKERKKQEEIDTEKSLAGGLTEGQWGPLLDLIAGKESGGNYEAMYPSTTLKGATRMTIAEVARRATGAVGKYQQLPQYLVGRAKAAGLNPEKDLYSPQNQEKIIINVNIKGRGGQKWLKGEMSDEEFMQGLSQEFASLPNAQGKFYYSGQRSSMTPQKVKEALSKVKKGGYSKEELSNASLENVKMGKGYGGGGVKIAGDLGDYMKKLGIVTGSIHRHPRHLPWSKSGHSRGSLHYQGRAIDLGGWAPSNPNSGGRDEQAPVIKAILEWNKRNGYSPVQLIHHSPKYKNVGSYQSDHNDHVHVAYEKGGETKPYPHIALVGEKGKEFVIDADSTAAIETTFPGFLDAVNKAKYDDAISVLRNFATYETGSEQIIMVMDDQNEQSDMQSSYEQHNMIIPSGSQSSDPFESLYMIG